MYQKRNKELEILALYTSDLNSQFYLREISRLSKIPLKTTQTSLSTLENKRVLKSVVSGKNKYFKLNFNNVETKLTLLQAELYKTVVLLNRYSVFKTFLKEIKNNIPLLVFGSFARLKAEKDSDLDLLIIQKQATKLPLHLLPYNIHKIEISEKQFLELLDKKEGLIEEIKKNHIILNNHSFIVDILWRYYGK